MRKGSIKGFDDSKHLRFLGEDAVQFAAVQILNHHIVDGIAGHLIEFVEIVKARIVMPMIGRGKFFFNFGFAIFVNIDICFKQVTDLQHGSPVKWISVPMTNLTECLIQLIEKGRVVFQVLLENRKLFFHDHIKPARFEERLGYLWQADHLIYKRKLADILTNMALNGKTISSGLLLR